MNIEMKSPDGKKSVSISTEPQTVICVTASPKVCSVHVGVSERAIRTLAEIMFHKGWAVHVS